MNRFQIDPRIKAEAPNHFLTDLVKPLLQRFEEQPGEVHISAEGVQQICRELRKIYRCGRDWQEALSQAKWQLSTGEPEPPSRHCDEQLLAAIEADNVILFPEPEEQQ